MSQLLKLKEWLTLEESATHISNLLGEPVTIADLYRLALDRRLTLSVNFVNHAQAKKGQLLKTEQVEFKLVTHEPFGGKKLDIPIKMPKNHEIRISKDNWVALEDPVTSIEGLWDLPMVGAERINIEREYQKLTSGIEVTLVNIEGAFVQRDNTICQLQDHFEIYEQESYHPASGLPEDSVLLIRTSEVARFIQSLIEPPVHEKPLQTNEKTSLLVIIGLLCEKHGFDYNARGAAKRLEDVAQLSGTRLTDDTILKVFKQVDEALYSKSSDG